MKKNNKEKNPEANIKEKIVLEPIQTEMRASYLDYAMSVITSRALPDIRDGLKPVHRRILYAMHGMGLSPTAKTRKSAAITGEVLGKYHPHGNIAVYDAMVNLTQPFKTRYPLVIGQGNFGSIDGDSPAAERYTEAKLSKISEFLLVDIDKNTVNFVPNYENTLKEPSVLPAISPNLFLNGTLGIAVGMTSKIPPHNCGEICDAIIHCLTNKNPTLEDLLEHVKGPDFPTGAVVYDKNAIKEAYKTGRGGVLVRGEISIEEDKKINKLVINSIPYRVNKSELIIKIGELIQAKVIEGVKDLRDESTNDIRIVLDLKSTANEGQIKNLLYKKTQLEEMFHYNMVCLIKGIPKTINLIEYLENYIEHRRIVVKKRTQFNLDKALAQEHILSGLSKALDSIDKIIALIKKAKDVADARVSLMKIFKFSEIQAGAILEMKLQKLSSLERKKIENELTRLQELIKKLSAVLKSAAKIDKEILTEVKTFSEQFSDDRRTKIVAKRPEHITREDLIEKEDVVITITKNGYIKRTLLSEYRSQKRGGVGMKGSELKEEDYTTLSIPATTLDKIYLLTNKGKIYVVDAYELPEGKRLAKGKALINYVSIDSSEIITSIIAGSKLGLEEENYLLFITKNGIIKKAAINKFNNIRKNGIIAINLDKQDELISTSLIEMKDEVFVGTLKGKAIRFKSSNVRTSGRNSRGVKCISLTKEDRVISGFVISHKNTKDSSILTITENGYCKKTKCKLFKVQNRGGVGIKVAEINEKTGELISIYFVNTDDSEILIITKNGKLIRIPLDYVPERGRQTQGVSIIKLKDGDTITTTAHL